MKRILLIGGGGHCRSVLDGIITSHAYEDIGIIDKDPAASALGVPVLGNDDDLRHLFNEGWNYAFITVGSVGNTDLRRRLYNMVAEIGFEIPSVVDSSAMIAGDVLIGEGVYVGKKAVINTGSKIGICGIVNTGAIVEHDCTIGSFSHISPGAVLCGNVKIGSDSHIGAASVVIQNITVGDNVMAGAGSVIVKDIPDNSKVYGNPCRKAEK